MEGQQVLRIDSQDGTGHVLASTGVLVTCELVTADDGSGPIPQVTPGPVELEPYARLTADLEDESSRRCLVYAFQPSDATWAAFEEDANYYDNPTSQMADPDMGISGPDTGVTVNGEPWTWFPVFDGRRADDENWRLIPADFVGNAAEVIRVGASFEGSMTGGASVSGVMTDGLLTYLWAWTDDGEPRVRSAELAPERRSNQEMAERLIDFIGLGDYLPSCPNYGNVGCDGSGWVVDLNLPEDVSMELLARVLRTAWVPCPIHSVDCQIEEFGRLWRWSDDQWRVAKAEM